MNERRCRRARQRDFDFGLDLIHDASGAKKDSKGIGLLFDRLPRAATASFSRL
jgi:hypothetical protein